MSASVLPDADWYAAVVAPVRKGLAAAGAPVDDLSDNQVMEASMRILSESDGAPWLADVGRIVDSVRFAGNLVESADMVAGEIPARPAQVVHETSALSMPRPWTRTA